MENNTVHDEIERRFLIRMPDEAYLNTNTDKTEIVQTYLLSASGCTARVRKRGIDGVYQYTHTEKRRISDIRRLECECGISEEEYRAYLRMADPSRRQIRKLRYCLRCEGQLFEIDVFPFWKDRAILEIELTDESQKVQLPPVLEIIREITGDRRYTNASLARHVPDEEI